MLSHLSIRNILLIKSAEIPFTAGLNVLTGETGAGKSILLDALGLVLGERGDASLIRTGETSASVTAEFELSKNTAVQALLHELELSAEDGLVIRRTLSADGKSRAFVNDAPVSAATLKRLGELLIVRHGQHDQRGLMDSKTHRVLIDAFAGNAVLLTKTAQDFAAWKAALAEAEALEERARVAAREERWLRDTVEELGALDPQPGEEVALAELRKKGQVAAQSLGALKEALALLTESEGVALSLRQVAKMLAKTGIEDTEVTAALERAEAEVETLSVALERQLNAADIDPRALEAADDRLHALRAAARKYHVAAEILPELLRESQEKLHTLTNLEAEQKRVEAARAKAEADYRAGAQKLHDTRAAAAEKLSKALAVELKPLKMATTQLRVQQTELPPQSWGAAGMHQVFFEVATNAGMPFGPMSKVASGGELSRLLLAMKVVLHGADAATSIFDEIDTGTGGAVAEAIGLRLKQLAKASQVLVVTHLPQVAALASHHLFISKAGTKQVTTDVKHLDDTARREELARMLSGATITEEARKTAEKLLQVVA